jgi:hypothetical protein
MVEDIRSIRTKLRFSILYRGPECTKKGIQLDLRAVVDEIRQRTCLQRYEQGTYIEK